MNIQFEEIRFEEMRLTADDVKNLYEEKQLPFLLIHQIESLEEFTVLIRRLAAAAKYHGPTIGEWSQELFMSLLDSNDFECMTDATRGFVIVTAWKQGFLFPPGEFRIQDAYEKQEIKEYEAKTVEEFGEIHIDYLIDGCGHAFDDDWMESVYQDVQRGYSERDDHYFFIKERGIGIHYSY